MDQDSRIAGQFVLEVKNIPLTTMFVFTPWSKKWQLDKCSKLSISKQKIPKRKPHTHKHTQESSADSHNIQIRV